METQNLLTLAAIILGPIAAVFVTRWLDVRRERNRRRMDVFRTLMRTRRTPIVPDHVGALNLIEIEFPNDKPVIDAWRSLLRHLANQHVRNERETIAPTDGDSTKSEKDSRFDDRLYQERQALLAKLLHAMAKALSFKIEQLEIFEGGYTPQGWYDVDIEQRVIRRFFVEVLAGHRSFPISVKEFPIVQPTAPNETTDSDA